MVFDPISYSLAKRRLQIIIRSDTPPLNTDVLWFDTNNNLLKYYNSSTNSWEAITIDDKVLRKLILSLG